MLLDILVEMNLSTIEHYSNEGVDGYMLYDDWGLQDRLMISPVIWRELWKPCYFKIFSAAHQAGMLTLMHSCGYIIEIIDDLIEAGLDIIQIDQQENMGLEALGNRFRGKITFFSPVDIQSIMVNGSDDEIRVYCHKMADILGTDTGGFIPKWYDDPTSVGHRAEAIDVMCEEFLKISGKRHKNK